MRRIGTLQIVCLDREAQGEAKYSVGFADYALPRGIQKLKEIVGEEALRNYLTAEVKVHAEAIQMTMSSLKSGGSAEIFHVALTEEQLGSLGLK
jgi:hypothetical protein